MMLSDVPDFFQLQVFKKMNPVAFVRTYRTNKYVMKLLEKNNDKISIPLPKTLRLDIHLHRLTFCMYIERMERDLREEYWLEDFEKNFNELGLYFFNFKEFYLFDNRLDDEIEADETASELISGLEMVKFDEFTTHSRCHISMFRELLQTKKVKLCVYRNGYDLENDEDLRSLAKILWSGPSQAEASYVLDTLANHVPSVKLNLDVYDFTPTYIHFVDLVERTLLSSRTEFSASMEGNPDYGTIEDLVTELPPPAK